MSPANMQVIRLDEEAVLKTVGCQSFGGSSPSACAINPLFFRGKKNIIK